MRRALLLTFALVLGIGLGLWWSAPFAPSRAAADSATEIVIDRDDIDVTTDVVVKPGTYRVRDLNGDGVLRVKADGVKLKLFGVRLDGAGAGQTPDTFDGVGVSVVGRRGVKIRGGAVRGFRVGVLGKDAPRLLVEETDVSGNRAMHLGSTPRREDPADWLWPHENDEGQWERTYGAGISLTGCERPNVRGCRAHRTQNGLLLTRCEDAVVFRNVFTFLSGWGIALYRSSRCDVVDNRCDYCVRGYSHGVYSRGQDSAGILVFEQSSDNVFRFNSARYSGDGFFLYAGNDTVKRTGTGGCNRNDVNGNDFSFAVANGIEATFSEGNTFWRNRLEGCDHGVWAGYSYRTTITKNEIVACANGISVEHGRENRVEANYLSQDALGIHLWWDDDPDLAASAFGKGQDTSSTRNVVVGNLVQAGETALRFESDTASRVEANVVRDVGVGIDASGSTAFASCAGNEVSARVAVRCATRAPLSLGSNLWTPWRVEGPQRVDVAPALQATSAGRWLPGPVPRPASEDAEGRRGGRETIVVDEWGPLDPALPAVFPAAQSAAGAATLRVLGNGLPYEIQSVSAGCAIEEPASGTAPATLHVARAKGARAASVTPFRVQVRVGDQDLVATGTLLSTRWTVRWYAWTKDPREDAAAWKTLVSGAPVDEAILDALDFAWQGGKPTPKVPADHFGTVAETTVTLPAGTWRLSTVSDDGIRVWVDGKLEIDDWTWHAPKELAKDLVLAAGEHAIRVEHFELDGWAALRVALEPVTDHR